MKRLFVILSAIFMLAGCAGDRIPDFYKDPACRDSVLLANKVTQYGSRRKISFFRDIKNLLTDNEEDNKKAEEKQLRLYRNGLKKISDEDLKFLEYLYGEYAELAVVADYAYLDSEVILPEGWSDMSENNERVDSIVSEHLGYGYFASGLKCSLLTKDDRQVIAFAGTDFPLDWGDVRQIVHFIKDVYEDYDGAMNDDASQPALAKELINSLIGAGLLDVRKLEFTGHSLGGRLASEMAVHYGCPATIFNAAGVSPGLYEQYEKLREDHPSGWRGYIVSIYSANDQLTIFQKYLSEYYDEEAERDYCALGAYLKLNESMSGHSIKPLAGYLSKRSDMCAEELESR